MRHSVPDFDIDPVGCRFNHRTEHEREKREYLRSNEWLWLAVPKPKQILRREVTCHVKDILRKETY